MKLKYPILLTSLVLSASWLPLTAKADHNYNRHSHYSDDYANHSYIKARVVEVTPVFERYTGRNTRYQERVSNCYSEPSRYDASDRRRKAVIGGVVGGLIGYQVGDKPRHKRIGAVAGAIIGSTIAKKSSDRDRVRCDRYYEPRVSDRARIIGYDVVYKYRGRHYTTFSEYRPGRWIEVERPRNYYRH